jgi:hypothetical protein
MAKQQYLSAARQWEANLKSGLWGFDEASFQQLPFELRHQVWMDVMVGCGSKSRDPSPETQARIEAILAA